MLNDASACFDQYPTSEFEWEQQIFPFD